MREPATTLQERRQQVLLRHADDLLRAVLVFATFGIAASAIVLADFGLPRARLYGLAGGFVTTCILQLGLVRLYARLGDVTRAALSSQVVGQVWMAILLTLTGGLHSPFLPAVAGAIVLLTLIFGNAPRGLMVSVFLFAAIAVVAALPDRVTGPPITGWHYTAVLLIMFTSALGVVRTAVGELALVNSEAMAELDEHREGRIAQADGHSRRLQEVGARVADELRTPLDAIRGEIAALSAEAGDDKTRERLGVVQREVERMEVILREYLSYSRPLEDLDPRSIDLASLAAESAAVVAGRAETGRIKLELRLRSARLIADPRRLREALLNLLSNAIDATPAGGTVTVETTSDGDGGAIVTVGDTGRGMRAEDVARLGTSFFTTRPDGTGLGVVLVKGVVAQHGGTLDYDTQPGRGTRVTIRMPARPPASASPVLQ